MTPSAAVKYSGERAAWRVPECSHQCTLAGQNRRRKTSHLAVFKMLREVLVRFYHSEMVKVLKSVFYSLFILCSNISMLMLTKQHYITTTMLYRAHRRCLFLLREDHQQHKWLSVQQPTCQTDPVYTPEHAPCHPTLSPLATSSLLPILPFPGIANVFPRTS